MATSLDLGEAWRRQVRPTSFRLGLASCLLASSFVGSQPLFLRIAAVPLSVLVAAAATVSMGREREHGNR
jgi:hypothetical protein